MSSRGRRQNPPPVRCSATAQRTGDQCERWAVPGRLQCKLHGAYAGRGGKAVAEERAAGTITLAEMMANNPGRPVWEVILDSIRTVDVLAQAAAQDVAQGRVTTAEGIERVAGLARSAHAMAASAVATKALDMATQVPRQWEAVASDRVAVLLLEWIGLPSGRAVIEAIKAALGDMDLNDSRPAPRPDGPPFLALVTQAQAAALAPRLGLAAGDLTTWFSRVADAVADGRPVPALPGAPIAALPAAEGSEGSERSEPLSSNLPWNTTPVVTAESKARVPHGEAGPEPSDRSDPSDPPAAEPEVLTLHGQAQAQAEEPEVVDAELVDEPEPERQPSRIFDEERRIYVRNPKYVRRASGSSGVTTLGYRGGQPTMPATRLSY
ncbi:hypothetical protein [Micromonospora peucetia]|uniref:Uncharacterized protein n=1 Tax=Micromonospora peucetia TaxID=47871 RepID=A0A1C6V4L7_9ACTN|nr:hypothetical protein [Micromonospora peucetia]SCL61024.1 hypothetical protein GA0070608_2404 [Micromonospora peucetia]